MSIPVRVAESCLEACRHVKELRDVNTAVLELDSGALVPETEANWTQDELLQNLPTDQARLIVHELSFATPNGARRHERLLIGWLPPDASAQELVYTAGYEALKEALPDVSVHVIARNEGQLAYPRLVALAN
ncbi:hypothetical protein ACIBG6_07610 [Streptomyces sp. NPDC050842]|uniref:hypothetical protein n=1 Tax=Streptomyces sp. NPDC050842 TaxID=3365636 RepID=UPI0037A45766